MTDTVQTIDSKALDAKTVDGWHNFLSRSGTLAQNVLSAGHYAFNNLTRNRLQLEAAYRTNWIAGMMIDVVAEDMTREGIEITSQDDPQKIARLQKELTRKGVWKQLTDLIRWARLYGGAVGVIMIDGQDNETPLDLETIGKGQFGGVAVFDRWQVVPDMMRLIQSGRDYGLPQYYQITSMDNRELVGKRFHHSRIIRQIGIELPIWQAMQEIYWGESVLERVNDVLSAFNEATMGAANLINKAHLRTIQVDRLREILAAGGKAQENLRTMFDYMRELQSNEGITLIDKNDEYKADSYSFGGLSDMILQFGQQISGATQIPLVRLFGQSPAGLSATGESDLRIYYDGILSQQESRLRDAVTKLLNIVYRNTFGASPPEDMDFEFTPLWQTSHVEKINMGMGLTQTILQAFEAGLIDRSTALKELQQQSKETGLYTNITEEQITEAENEPPPIPEEAAGEVAKPISMEPSNGGWLGKIKGILSS